MADGYARATGKPGVAFVITGPGLTNTLTAMGQARADSVPMLVVSPGMPVRHPQRGNGLLHEARDQRAALAAVARLSHLVAALDELTEAVAQIFVEFLVDRAPVVRDRSWCRLPSSVRRSRSRTRGRIAT